jgi:ketosteroid isomerase-like protein
MYKRIVRRKVVQTFEAVSRQDPAPMLASLAGRFTYRFAGTNALSGVRTTRDEISAWWARIFELFPGARFEVRDVVVAGPPWRTTVATHVLLCAPRAGTEDYRNEFMQLLRLRWGRVTEILTLEDTQRCQGELDAMAASGVQLAHAAPIGEPSLPPLPSIRSDLAPLVSAR